MNQEHIDQWVEWMRTTTLPQTTGNLAALTALDDESKMVLGYCCLGLGSMKAGITHELPDPDNEGEDATTYGYFGAEGVESLAPREFIDWLGIPVDEDDASREFDILIDWPTGLRTRPGTFQTHGAYFTSNSDVHSCAGLNDYGFTFAQIADIVAYFGIKGVGDE